MFSVLTLILYPTGYGSPRRIRVVWPSRWPSVGWFVHNIEHGGELSGMLDSNYIHELINYHVSRS